MANSYQARIIVTIFISTLSFIITKENYIYLFFNSIKDSRRIYYLSKQEVRNSKTLEMTETSRCLDSHPKFLCTIGASIFSLQAHSIQQTFPWSRKFQRQFSHYLLCPAECLADSFMNQEPQKIITPLGKFSSPLSVGSLCPVYATVQAISVSCQVANQLHKEPLRCPFVS